LDRSKERGDGRCPPESRGTMNSAKQCHEVEGLKILVDGFKHAAPSVTAYFLTHFHGDHYTGLTPALAKSLSAPIYCTPVTARLLQRVMGVDESCIQEVSIGNKISVPGGEVQFVDAHHCPGAAMLIITRHSDGKTILHCGDMRYHPAMKEDFAGLKIDTVYLDTTYAHPRHSFISQEESLAMVREAVDEHTSPDSKTLFMVGAYTIGKERVMLALARHTGAKIYLSPKKKVVLDCLGYSCNDLEHFTDDETEAIHVCSMAFAGRLYPYFQPDFKKLEDYMRDKGLDKVYTRAMVFLPTGFACSKWNAAHSHVVQGPLSVKLIPYSEHSSYSELSAFLAVIKPREIVPTVFADEADCRAIRARFNHLTDSTAQKRAFFDLMRGGRKRPRAEVGAASLNTKGEEKVELEKTKDEKKVELEKTTDEKKVELEKTTDEKAQLEVQQEVEGVLETPQSGPKRAGKVAARRSKGGKKPAGSFGIAQFCVAAARAPDKSRTKAAITA
ncbi:unnamed protein product, partial [Chrysoparadoxa australica]